MVLAGNRAIPRTVIVTVFLACCTRASVIYVSSSRENVTDYPEMGTPFCYRPAIRNSCFFGSS